IGDDLVTGVQTCALPIWRRRYAILTVGEESERKRMSRVTKLVVLSVSVIILCYVGLGYVLGKTGDDKTYRSLTVFSEVLQHIQRSEERRVGKVIDLSYCR